MENLRATHVMMVYVDKQPMRTVTTSVREIQTSREDDWTEHILPIGVFLTLYIKPRAAGATPTCFASVIVFFVRLRLRTLGRSLFSTYW